jgi:hypothetical protein
LRLRALDVNTHSLVFVSVFPFPWTAFFVPLLLIDYLTTAPPKLRHARFNCAIVALLAQFSTALKNVENSILSFVYNALTTLLELRHRNCIGMWSRQPIINILWQKF